MGLENLKRWHWMIIGLLVGALFGGTRVFWRDPEAGSERSYDRVQFTDELHHGMEVRNLVLHPPIDGQEWVTFEAYQLKGGSFGPRLMRRRPASTQPAQERPGDWIKFPLLAADATSKRPVYIAPSPATAAEYLDRLQKQFKDQPLTAKVAWWEFPKYTVGMYAAAGFVVIGVVWPTLVNLLTGAGLGGQKKVVDDYDLSRFKGESAAPVAAKAPVDEDALAALNAKMERDVAEMIIGSNLIDADEEEEAATIRQLQTQSMDATEVVSNAAEESKEYKGEFYPVVKPGGAKGQKPGGE